MWLITDGLGGGSAKRWWIENAAEIRPAAGSGQWMLKYTAGEVPSLLYAPVAGEAPPAQHEIELAALGNGCDSNQPWLGSSAALVWAHGQNPTHQLAGVSFVGVRFTSTATWYQGDGGQPWLPWLFSSAVHVGTSSGFRMVGCSFTGTGNGLMVIDSSSATVERTSFDDSGGVSFTFRNCEGCVANNSWVRGCSKEIFGAACVYYKGTPSSVLSHCDISGGDHNGLGIDNANQTSVEVSYNRIHDNGREDGYGTNDYGGFRAAMAGGRSQAIHRRFL